MPFINSLFLLAGVVSAVMFPVFFGHWLAERNAWPIVAAVASLLLSALCIWIYLRLAARADAGLAGSPPAGHVGSAD